MAQQNCAAEASSIIDLYQKLIIKQNEVSKLQRLQKVHECKERDTMAKHNEIKGKYEEATKRLDELKTYHQLCARMRDNLANTKQETAANEQTTEKYSKNTNEMLNMFWNMHNDMQSTIDKIIALSNEMEDVVAGKEIVQFIHKENNLIIRKTIALSRDHVGNYKNDMIIKLEEEKSRIENEQFCQKQHKPK